MSGLVSRELIRRSRRCRTSPFAHLRARRPSSAPVVRTKARSLPLSSRSRRAPPLWIRVKGAVVIGGHERLASRREMSSRGAESRRCLRNSWTSMSVRLTMGQSGRRTLASVGRRRRSSAAIAAKIAPFNRPGSKDKLRTVLAADELAQGDVEPVQEPDLHAARSSPLRLPACRAWLARRDHASSSELVRVGRLNSVSLSRG